MLWEPKYCNCLFWGLYVKIVYRAKLKIISSTNWNVKGGNWHIICIFKNGEIRSYVPIDQKSVTSWLQVMKTILFEGKIIDGDRERNRTLTSGSRSTQGK